jgi:hypothetical protein
MRIIRAGLRPAFGLFVVAHGLAHSLLPLRGGMDPATLPKDFMPMILYGVAVIGFCVAGLGITGWRPFSFATRPALVLAAAYSLIGMVRMQTGDAWGVTADVVLLLLGLTGLYQRLPMPAVRARGFGHVLRVTGGVAFVTAAVIIVLRLPFRM